MTPSRLPGPPPLLRLAAEPLRWALLAELSRSDRKVEELAIALDRPQNLVSYHLGKLRSAGLVDARRSSHDGRDVYYHLDISRCAGLFATAALSLHPALAAQYSPNAPIPQSRVLFLCTENSARSQMAEGLLRHASRGAVSVASAGSRPSSVHPHAVRAMAALGIDISAQRSSHLDEFAGSSFDVVITVCDRVREECPSFEGAAAQAHWSIPDPATEGADAGSYTAFERAANELAGRVDALLPALAARLPGA